MLDELQQEHPERRVVRLRPGVVLQAAAASELARYFLGPFVPQSLVRRALLPLVPAVSRLAVQAVHAEDVASAYVLAATTPVTGAFNIAAEPVLDPAVLARLLAARQVPLPAAVLRGLVNATWRLHLQPTDPGWVDIARLGPLMDTTRAQDVLGWTPRTDAGTALVETLDAMPTAAVAARPSCVPGPAARRGRWSWRAAWCRGPAAPAERVSFPGAPAGYRPRGRRGRRRRRPPRAGGRTGRPNADSAA